MHTLHIVGGQYPFPWISALGCRLIQETFIECQQRPGSVVSLPLEQAAHYSQNSKERGDLYFEFLLFIRKMNHFLITFFS